MYLKSNNTSLLILAITAILASRIMFCFLNDPKGPNLLIVTVIATVVYFLSLPIYLFKLPATGINRLFLVILTQIILVTGFYLWAR